jgi:hypothetical protein
MRISVTHIALVFSLLVPLAVSAHIHREPVGGAWVQGSEIPDAPALLDRQQGNYLRGIEVESSAHSRPALSWQTAEIHLVLDAVIYQNCARQASCLVALNPHGPKDPRQDAARAPPLQFL